MIITRTLPELRAAARHLGGLSFVPTMGALHSGHVSLLAAARASGRPVAASIFVNPTQFGPAEDFNHYPRDEAGDLAQLEAAGCDLVWLPDVTTMYPPGSATSVNPAGPALLWEGAARRGHFAGVTTVVTKLFGQVQPEAAYFGEKDWQQVQVVRQLAADLHLPVEIIPVATARARDGLALSSRNRFLQPAERARAPALFAALCEAARRISSGGAVAPALAAACATVTQSGMAVQYIALVHAHTLVPCDTLAHPARLLAAARLGTVRLLDNLPVTQSDASVPDYP